MSYIAPEPEVDGPEFARTAGSNEQMNFARLNQRVIKALPEPSVEEWAFMDVFGDMDVSGTLMIRLRNLQIVEKVGVRKYDSSEGAEHNLWSTCEPVYERFEKNGFTEGNNERNDGVHLSCPSCGYGGFTNVGDRKLQCHDCGDTHPSEEWDG